MLREIEKQTFSPKYPEPICHMRLILRMADAGVMKRFFIENGRFTFEKLLTKHIYHRRFQRDAADTLQWLADPDKPVLPVSAGGVRGLSGSPAFKNHGRRV